MLPQVVQYRALLHVLTLYKIFKLLCYTGLQFLNHQQYLLIQLIKEPSLCGHKVPWPQRAFISASVKSLGQRLAWPVRASKGPE